MSAHPPSNAIAKHTNERQGTRTKYDIALLVLVACVCRDSIASVPTSGVIGDGTKSLIYDARTGDVSLDVPFGRCAATIQVTSNVDLFTGPAPLLLDGPFDVFRPRKLFLLKPNGITGIVPLGPLIAPGVSQSVMSEALSLTGGACKTDESQFSDLVYLVPEPDQSAYSLCILTAWTMLSQRVKRLPVA